MPSISVPHCPGCTLPHWRRGERLRWFFATVRCSGKPPREWGDRYDHDSEAFWARVAEHDRQAALRKAERQKELIKQAVREVLDERERA